MDNRKNFVMADDPTTQIHYNRVSLQEFRKPACFQKIVPSTPRFVDMLLTIHSIDLFPPIADSIKLTVCMISRDLCGAAEILDSTAYLLDPMRCVAKIEHELKMCVPNEPAGSGTSILFEIELDLPEFRERFFWVVYPLTNFEPLIKRLPMQSSTARFDFANPPRCQEHATSRKPSSFVFFSLREENISAPLTSRPSFTPVCLSPRQHSSVLLNMFSIEEWAKSWISASTKDASSNDSQHDLNLPDTAKLKSQIMSDIISKYSV